MQLDQVHAGDRLRVRPGEKVPVDSVVIEGRSAADEVHGHRRVDARDQRGRRERHRRHHELIRCTRDEARKVGT